MPIYNTRKMASSRIARRLPPRRGLSSSAAAQLLHQSRIPTLHFQDSLPRMPIPALEATLERFIYFAQPLVDDDEMLLAQRAAHAFARREGPALQAALVTEDKVGYTSYISQPWFDMYLRDRSPLLLNFNPQLTFQDEKSPPSQTNRAARLCRSAGLFLKTLEAGVLEPDIFHTVPSRSKHPLWPEVMRNLPRSVAFYGAAATGAYALDMSQYANLFRSTRVPMPGRDELRAVSDSRHLVVQRGGAIWTVDLFDKAGNTVPAAQLQGAFDAIVKSPGTAATAPGVGYLTSLPRDEWASLRSSLAAADPANAAALRAIDEAVFAVCLDDAAPEELGQVNRTMLHGKGTDRWLDKSFQLIVTANAKAAINFEHSWGDGVAVLRFANEIFDHSTAMPTTEKVAPPASPPKELQFALPPSLKEAVADAASRFDASVRGTQLATVMRDDFTTGSLKRGRVSPDGMMQMSFQLAMAKLRGKTVSTYESASTAAFKHGRTETIRSATPESKAFTDAFRDSHASPQRRAALMRAAVRNHTRVTRDAMTGNGMDRHLFVLAQRAKAAGLTPALFETAAYRKMSSIIISTSTLSSHALANGGFGPFHPDCFAVGYAMRSDVSGAQVRRATTATPITHLHHRAILITSQSRTCFSTPRALPTS
jgi:carnitine O-palmitoyltransferase 2